MIKKYINFYPIINDDNTIGDELRRFESGALALAYAKSLTRRGIKFATEFQTVEITRRGSELLESLFSELDIVDDDARPARTKVAKAKEQTKC